MNTQNNPSHRWLMAAFALFGLALPGHLSAQSSEQPADSAMVAIRLATLNNRKANLKKQIEQADKKRNQVIDGVSPETMERMNTAQDSICLELRSQLVGVELEIAELTPAAVPAQILQQYNRLRKQQETEGNK